MEIKPITRTKKLSTNIWIKLQKKKYQRIQERSVQSKKDEVWKKIIELKEKRATASTKAISVDSNISDNSRKIAKLTGKNTQLTQELVTLQAEIPALDIEIAAKEAELKQIEVEAASSGTGSE